MEMAYYAHGVTIDWQCKESVHAVTRSKIKRLLARHGGPPDLEEKAVELVLEQAELFSGAGETRP